MRRPPRWPSGPSRPARRCGGKDASSAALIQGSTLAGVLLDEAALDKILDPYSMTEPGISGKELLEG